MIKENTFITERNCILVLISLFLLLSVLIALVPYNPEKDLADATTNRIWIDYYAQGVFHIPWNEWNYPPTQSVVVEYEGEYVVVNEKGPGHVLMMLPLYFLRLEGLFGLLMIAIAVFSTYMLGKRLCNWVVGFIASLFVLCNLSVIVMGHRYYWTDASTMHMLIFSIWLLVEANFWYNSRTLDPKKICASNVRWRFLGIGLGVFSGLTFGLSVSTRYPTAVILIAMFSFIFVFYLLRVWPFLKKKEILKALKKSSGMWVILGAFLLGLMFVLIPLMSYNSEYFGGPFSSGYDCTVLTKIRDRGWDPYVDGLNPRNTSSSWMGNIFDTSTISTVAQNFFILLPVFISRMPAIVLAPLGVWVFRKKSALILLFPWIFINFYTYLSLSGVRKYVEHLEIAWEPRYWMPSIPAIALLASAGVYGVAKWIINNKTTLHISKDNRRTVAVFFTIVMAGIIVMAGLIPSLQYLATFDTDRIPGPRPDGRRPPPRPPPPPNHSTHISHSFHTEKIFGLVKDDCV